MKTLDPNEEIRAIKGKLSNACDNDIHRIAEEARRNYQSSMDANRPTPPAGVDSQNTTNQPLNPSSGSTVA